MSVFKIKFNEIQLIFLLFIYKILIDISYCNIISPLYYYYMDLVLDIDYIKVLESYILLVFLFVFTPKSEEKITKIFLNIQFLLMIVPMLSLYGLSSRSREFMYWTCICHVLQCIISKKYNFKKREILYQNYKLIFWGLIVGLSIVTMGLILFKYGFPDLRALDLEKVYDVRAEHSLFFPISYFMPWLAGVIMPLLFILGIENRKYIIVIISIFCEGILYLQFANKAHLFAFIMIIIVYFAKKTNRLLEIMYMGFPAMVLVSSLIYYINYSLLIIPSLFIRRVLFLPAVIKFKYYDFFSSGDKLFLSDGIIGRILEIESPYQKEAVHLIAEYVEQPQSWINTGYIADAYANFGIFGMLIFSIILIYILKYLDKCTQHLDISVVCGISVYSLYALNDGALLTRLLTGGFILLIFLLNLLNMNKNNMKRKRRKYVWNFWNFRFKAKSKNINID